MITDNPLVSVLIPAYNHQDYVQKTIQSIINQTYQNIELIIIDDGSTDDTWKKILDMKSLCDKRFVHTNFKSQENQGTCKTFNKLINSANGEYIYIIASDDIANKDAIKTECDFLCKNPDYALCVGDNEIIDANSKICYLDKNMNIVHEKEKAEFMTFGQYLQKEHNFSFSSEEFGRYDKLYVSNHIPNGYMIRKSIFEKIGYFTPEAPLEDYWLMLQISKYAKMKYLEKALFYYRLHQNNTIKNKEKMLKLTNLTKMYEEKILENVNPDKVLPAVKNVYTTGIFTKKTGIKNIFEILTYEKFNSRIKIFKLFNSEIMRKEKNRK